MVQLVSDGIEIAYDDSGGIERDALVLLHGLGSARSTWDPIIPALFNQRRVLAFDQRGHGESSHASGTYTLEHYVPDAIAFCETVTTRPVVLVGHSLGGVVAASVACTRPDLVRGLLLEDPPLYRGEPGEAEGNPFLAVFALLHQLVSDMQARRAPLAEYEIVLRSAPSPNGAGSFADVLGVEGTRARARGLASLDPDVFLSAVDGSGLVGAQPGAALQCPVLVLRADTAFGPAFTAEHEARFRSANSRAEVEVIHGASHFIHDEQPERFLLKLHKFLDAL
ncbi:MAG: alpha/beta hydrolase [Acidimicrobiales bacterium]|nr:alpha/beta hydrolase [Acidimicrobiales bacterium]